MEKNMMNTKGMTDAEFNEFVNELREDGYDEYYIRQMQEERDAQFNATDNNGVSLGEKFGGVDPLNPNGQDYNPLDIDRREWVDGLYRARTISAKLITQTKTDAFTHEEYDRQVLRLEIKLFDDALKRDKIVTANYYESFFDTLFESWSTFFSDYAPHTLKDCIKLTSLNDWYVSKKTNGSFVNYNPLRQSPTAIPKNHERYIVIDLL